MRRWLIGLLVVVGMSASAEAGILRPRRVNLQLTDGTVMTDVPLWAARAIQESRRPLHFDRTSRRPWVQAYANLNTPAGRMARYYQNGGGAGPVPDYTNEPFHWAPPDTYNYPIP